MVRRVSILVLLAIAGLSACGSNDTTLKVTGIEPDRGDADGGQYVKIYGNAFVNPVRIAKVYFGSREGTVDRFASDSEMVVQAPGGKDGETVDVLIIFEPGGEKKIPKAFTFVSKNTTAPSVNDLDTNKDEKKK